MTKVERLSACIPDALSNGFALPILDVGQNNFGAFPSQKMRRGLADAERCSGDDGDLILHPAHG
jgi:hypothetical protein